MLPETDNAAVQADAYIDALLAGHGRTPVAVSGDAGSQGDRMEVGGIPIVTRVVEGLSIPELRNLSDTLRSKLRAKK